ncbi:MAG: hypothetical protein H7255_11550 [Ramlibacter sp.]|nr:hypothetical protein [Ramlibacter sp.]
MSQDALSALRELCAVKEMREDISRRKQRRENSPFRNRAGALAVRAAHDECKVREYRAWNSASAVIASADRCPCVICNRSNPLCIAYEPRATGSAP